MTRYVVEAWDEYPMGVTTCSHRHLTQWTARRCKKLERLGLQQIAIVREDEAAAYNRWIEGAGRIPTPDEITDIMERAKDAPRKKWPPEDETP